METKTCGNCHWWFQRKPNKSFNDCVLHIGLKKSKPAKVRFKGMLKTRFDFGCVEWRGKECD